MANTTNLNLSKLAGTEKLKTFPSMNNDNLDAIDGAFGADFGLSGKPSVNAAINSLGDGLAILANGDTHAAITAGQFVYVRGHGSLSEGLYTATSNIAQNGTLSGSNLTADSSGGLNALNSKLSDYSYADAVKYGSLWESGVIRAHRRGYVVTFKLDGMTIANVSGGRQQIGTLPEGYRPVTEISFYDDGKSRQFIITSSGVVQAAPQSAGQMWGSVTYVCNR